MWRLKFCTTSKIKLYNTQTQSLLVVRVKFVPESSSSHESSSSQVPFLLFFFPFASFLS